MKFKKFTILSILTLALFTGCSDKEKIDEDALVSKKEQVQQVPTFNLTTSTGTKITITADVEKGWKFEGFDNKVILLDFFGTWCPPCKAEIPHLNNIRKKLKNDFEIIAIDVGQRGGGDTPINELNQFIKDYEIKYPVAVGNENKMLFSAISELNPAGSIPFMVLFNKKGQFIQYYIGMVQEEILMNDINKAINMK
jgi:thiol-disulfide isomerase/thioredoxin